MKLKVEQKAKITSRGNYEISFSTKELHNLYLAKKYDKLSEKFFDILTYFWNTTYLEMDEGEKNNINAFIKTFLTLFTDPHYIIAPVYAETFVNFSYIISNIVAMSSYKNTDEFLETLNYKKNKSEFYKFLTLYSARNTIKVDYDSFSGIDPHLFSLWYSNYCSLASYPCELMNDNLINHINNMNDKLAFTLHSIYCPYFITTYYYPDKERQVRETLNKLTQNTLKNIHIKNTPQKNKIAILSANWRNAHVVHQSCSEYINALKDDYELDLINLSKKNDDLEIGLFKNIKNIYFTDSESIDLSPVMDNDYIIAFYPDIGMNRESIYLSNLRIAPVQITTYGHPASTFGSEIDYFIGGTEVEDLNRVSDNYSERLILIPGIALHPRCPVYKKQLSKQKNERLIINCQWMSHKVNYRMLKNLSQILQLSDKKILFRFFPSLKVHYDSNFIPFENDLKEILGPDNIEIVHSSKYQKYMEVLEQGDISIYSYPFGGFFTIIDSLYLGKPIIVFEGTKAYNRFESALLKRLNLEELISYNDDEYINRTVNLINNNDYRLKLSEKIDKTDLTKLFNSKEPEYFQKAIDYLIVNHDKLKNENSKEPIVIDW